MISSVILLTELIFYISTYILTSILPFGLESLAWKNICSLALYFKKKCSMPLLVDWMWRGNNGIRRHDATHGSRSSWWFLVGHCYDVLADKAREEVWWWDKDEQLSFGSVFGVPGGDFQEPVENLGLSFRRETRTRYGVPSIRWW